MRRVPRAVVWQEGLLMTPEHLQAQDVFHLDHAGEALRAICGEDAHGVISLSFDDDQLLDGALVLTRAHVLFPSGEPYLLNIASEDDALVLMLPSVAASAQPPSSLRIFLSVMPRDYAHKGHQRNASNQQTQHDALDDGAVELTRTEATLTTEAALAPVGESIEIAQLALSPEGVWRRDEHFVARCLRFSAASALMRRLQALLRRLLQHRAELRQQQGAERINLALGFEAMARRQALDKLVVGLTDLAQDSNVSARTAYQFMRQLAAELLLWVDESLGGALLRQSSFVATDLTGTFAPLFGIFEAFLANAPQASLLRRRFVSSGTSSTLQLNLRAQDVEAFNHFVLAIEVLGTPTEEIALHIAAVWPRLAKLAAPTELNFAVSAALSAVPLKYLAHPPEGLVRRDDVVYLAVDTSHPSWSAVLAEGAIALEPPRLKGVTQDVQVELIGLCDSNFGGRQ